MSEILYRHAGLDDQVGLLELLHAMHEENGVVPANWAKVARHVRAVIGRGDAFLAIDPAGIVDQGPDGAPVLGQKIVGSAALVVDTPWYSDHAVLHDAWVFVDPYYRRTRIADELFRWIEVYSQGLGLPLVLTVMTPERPERKLRFYHRRFRPVGAVFMGGSDVRPVR